MDGGIKPASLGQVAAALSLSIGTQSESEIQAQNTAQKLMLVGKGLIDKMAQDTKAALAASRTAQDFETAASILLVLATLTMGVCGAMECSEALSETSTLGKVSKVVTSVAKPVQVVGFAGSSVALIAESVYQGIQGKLEGKISVEQTDSQSAYKDATALINDVKDTIKSQANIATISAEYIRNNLAAKTATLNN